MQKQDRAHRVLFVTGPSGAGRSTAINALEDLGFETIDNMPLSLLPRLLGGPPLEPPLAFGLDVRNRDFSSDIVANLFDKLEADPTVAAELLYLDASPDTLLRRYSETRRRHPLASDDPPETGIARELDLLVPLRHRAGILIDTSELTPHDLRAEIERHFAPDADIGLAVTVQSFSFKRGVPRGIDLLFDVRFLRNPYWEPALRGLDGRDPAVASHIEEDPRYAEFFDRVLGLTRFLLPAYKQEGKAHLTIGLGCTGGQHRSVALAERLAKGLAEAGWRVSIRHRELERRVEARPAN
ncbi:MAG: RNase adapter RapZ [Rhodobacteraceae bacterium]|nr:RNase adapter RapZ [Paracoccaceae bacterium]